MIRCLSCFKEYDGQGVCPYCGKAEVKQKEPIDLMPGTILADRYIIGENAGTGGFGIIYKAFDLKFETIIAVKEYYPSRIVTRAAGTKDIIVNSKGRDEYEYRKKRFLAEARNMAKLGDHKNIPNVFEYFEGNNTAYIVMEFLEGMSLSEMLNQPEYTPDQDFAIFVANEVGNALIALHKYGILHRDVAPDNIFVCSDRDLKVKLLDLGAARLADDDDDVIDIVLKPGYSPIEQYVDDKKSRKGIDERADIYALGATLYHLLTGVKPEESSNRKIQDNLEEPKNINTTIDDNLSNSVMKAMAIEKHMRFKSVEEFLNAINGSRRVIPLKQERRNRKFRQVALIALSLLVVIGAAIALNFYYESKREVVYLPDSQITVWYIDDDSDGKTEAMEYIASDFMDAFPNVTVELVPFSEIEYYEALNEAAVNNQMPDLFESSNADDSVMELANSVDNVLSSDQASDCLFLDQYDNYYNDHKKIPLAIEIPLVCVITNGNTMTDYDSSTFGSLDDFGVDTISVDSQCLDLVNRNFDYSDYAPMEAFMDNTNNTSSVLVTTTMRINDIRSNLTSYEKAFVYPETDNVYCRFIYEWSICATNSNELASSERLLSWMLGNVYQSSLMINTAGRGEIPINREAFNTKISQSDYYAGIVGEAYRRFIFVREETETTE